jgi:hypothetical protein
MPWVAVFQLSSRVPPMVGIACAYHSWFVSIVKPNRLPRKPRGKPCVHGIIGVPAGIQPTL